MKKNEVLELTCFENTYDGYGKCLYDDQTIYVYGLLKDEKALVKIIAIKSKAIFGKIEKIILPSIFRIKPKCSSYGKCGGCDYQHMSYDLEALMKYNRVLSCVTKIGHIDHEINPIIKADKLYNYRNKVIIPVQYDNNLKMGFYRKRSNDIIEFDDCIVQTDESNDLYHDMRDVVIKYHLENYLRYIMIKHAHINNEIMIVLIMNKKIKLSKYCIDDILSLNSNIKTIIMHINNRNDNVILDNEEYILYGDGYITEKLLDKQFRISSKSFYQVNPYQTVKLYSKVIEYADIKENDIVVDLYCGTGTIGILLSDKASKVIGIDIVEKAIEDAKINARINNVNNIKFKAQDASIAIDEIHKEYQDIDVLVVDPPRKGLNELGIQHIIEANPKKLIYVSCDPSTLGRDLKTLVNHFNIKEIQPVDMFPLTEHVETIVSMIRK